jgi:hypothetical protein
MAATLDRLMSEKQAGAVVKSAAVDTLMSLEKLHELANR